MRAGSTADENNFDVTSFTPGSREELGLTSALSTPPCHNLGRHGHFDIRFFDTFSDIRNCTRIGSNKIKR